MIEIVTALIRNERGYVLLVRKHGTDSFMQPGGKREANESDLTTLTREIREELGCAVVPDSIQPLGTFEAQPPTSRAGGCGPVPTRSA